MARGLPDSGMHEDGRVNAYDIVVEQGHGVPPISLDVVFQLYTVLPVVVNC